MTETMSFTQLLSIHLGVTSLVCLVLEGRLDIVMHPFFSLLPQCIFAFVFWPCHVVCETLVPPPKIKSKPPAVEAQCSTHWAAGNSRPMLFWTDS